MRRRQVLPPITADEGEGNVTRLQRVGNSADRLAGKMRIEQGTMHILPRDGLKRVANIACGADYGKPRLLQDAGNVESDEEFVFNHEDPCRSHPRLPLPAKQCFGHEFI